MIIFKTKNQVPSRIISYPFKGESQDEGIQTVHDSDYIEVEFFSSLTVLLF